MIKKLIIITLSIEYYKEAKYHAQGYYKQEQADIDFFTTTISDLDLKLVFNI